MSAPDLQTALLLDYGGVLSLPQSADDLRAVEAAVPDVDPAGLWGRYWALRHGYDQGQEDTAYWTGVLGRAPSADELARLVALDAASWSRLDDEVVSAVEGLAARGVRLGVLSNMPTSLARALEDRAWAAPFDALVFSADVGAAKPEPQAYAVAAAALGVPAQAVVFVDDRAENVAGAHAAGMRAVHHRGASSTLAELERLLG